MSRPFAALLVFRDGSLEVRSGTFLVEAPDRYTAEELEVVARVARGTAEAIAAIPGVPWEDGDA